jgi:hypothetical protein
MTSVIKGVLKTARERGIVGSDEKIYRWVWVAICGVDTVVSGLPSVKRGEDSLMTYGRLFGVPNEWRYEFIISFIFICLEFFFTITFPPRMPCLPWGQR